MSMTSSPPPSAPVEDWHAMPADAVLRQLTSTPDGLGPVEAARRLALHGPNTLPSPPRTPALLRFLLQFNNALILFLLVAALAAVMAWPERRRLQTKAARTMVVNMLCVLGRNSSHNSGV